MRVSWINQNLAIVAISIFPSIAFSQIERGRFVDSHVVAGLDSPHRDGTPFVTPDGLAILFESQGPSNSPFPTWENNDIYIATRESISDPFGPRTKIEGPINLEGFGDWAPELSSDRLSLYFDRGQGPNVNDGVIWVSHRESLDAPWQEPTKLGPAVNDPGHNNVSPTLSNDELTIIYSRGLGDEWNLFQATRNSVTEEFKHGTSLELVNTNTEGQVFPSLSANGLALFYNQGADQLANELWVATRESLADPFGNPMNINDLGLGSDVNQNGPTEFGAHITSNWPAPGSKVYYVNAASFTDWDIMEATWTVERFADTNLDGKATAADIDTLSAAIRDGLTDPLFDLNKDGNLDQLDRETWIMDRMQTFPGDANLDGEFNSTDFIDVFQAGQYEDNIPMNSSWDAGDWNGDAEFDSGDFVTAFQAGGYELGPRIASQVPEPSAYLFVVTGILGMLRQRRRLKR